MFMLWFYFLLRTNYSNHYLFNNLRICCVTCWSLCISNASAVWRALLDCTALQKVAIKNLIIMCAYYLFYFESVSSINFQSSSSIWIWSKIEPISSYSHFFVHSLTIQPPDSSDNRNDSLTSLHSLSTGQ